MSHDPAECHRPGFVSLWVGAFPSLEAAESYFGIPDEIGDYLPPEAFAADVGLTDLPPDRLEVNFEQTSARPFRELLLDASFAESFLDAALEAAARQGIHEAQGVALLYDIDYQARAGRQDASGPLRFLGSFPYARTSPEAPDEARDPRFTVRDITDTIW